MLGAMTRPIRRTGMARSRCPLWGPMADNASMRLCAALYIEMERFVVLAT